jgi:hypothetical protein
MALFSLWMVIFGPNELASRVGSLLFSVIFLMASFLAFDRSLGYKVVIHANGLMIQGMLFSRLILWDEIIAIKAQPNYRFPGYYASVTVDGSRNPRRHWSSLWFGFYDIASHMQLGGEELARLFRHAKRRAESGWTNTRGPAIQKPVKKTRNEVTPI